MRIVPIISPHRNNRNNQNSVKENPCRAVSFQAGDNYPNIVLGFLKNILSHDSFTKLVRVKKMVAYSLDTTTDICKDSPEFLKKLILPVPDRFYSAVSKAKNDLKCGESMLYKSYKIEKFEKTVDDAPKEVIRISRPYSPNGKTVINIACDLSSDEPSKMKFLIGEFE